MTALLIALMLASSEPSSPQVPIALTICAPPTVLDMGHFYCQPMAYVLEDLRFIIVQGYTWEQVIDAHMRALVNDPPQCWP